MRTFEKCTGSEFCAGKRACLIVQKANSDMNQVFRPLVSCRKNPECACAQVAVTSRTCNAASKCDINERCRNNRKDCGTEALCFPLLDSNKLGDQLCKRLLEEDDSTQCRCAVADEIILTPCNVDSDCEDGEEICQSVGGVDGKRCIGKNPSRVLDSMLPDWSPPSSAPGAEPCIAVDALKHIHADNLVYREHLRSAVLCDANGSCASPGHIVEYGNAFMSMNSYCKLHALNGCTQTVRMVNSPKMSRGLRIDSRTTNLKFTALSARYQSQIEERILSLALAVGL